jgi:hypothetical protein
MVFTVLGAFMRQFWLASLMLLIGADPASASDWVYLGSTGTPNSTITPDSEFWSADLESARRLDNIAYIWVRIARVTEGAEETHTAGKTYYRIDCTARNMKILSNVIYDSRGNVTHSGSFPDTSYGADPIVPDSMGEAIAEVACK